MKLKGWLDVNPWMKFFFVTTLSVLTVIQIFGMYAAKNFTELFLGLTGIVFNGLCLYMNF